MLRRPSPSSGPLLPGRPRPCMNGVRWTGTDGPSVCRFKRPAISSIESRIASPSSRWIGARGSQRFCGSISSAFGPLSDGRGTDFDPLAICQVFVSTMRRINRFSDQPSATNVSAR